MFFKVNTNISSKFSPFLIFGVISIALLLFTNNTYALAGAINSTVKINSSTINGPTLFDGDRYGYSVANIGDLNNDGVTDLAVGAHYNDSGGTNRGVVYIHFMNVDGSIDSTAEINSSTVNGPALSDSDMYGVSIENIGDLNGDGVQDLAVGAHRDDNGGTDRGAIYIHFMNTDGSIDSTVEINSSTVNGPTLSDDDKYGRAIANIGDLNNDGVQDLAVGANLDDNAGIDSGTFYIHFMNTDGSIDSTVEINNSTTNGPILTTSNRYGTTLANIGDLNGDGVQDIAVGAFTDSHGGSNRGKVHIHFMNTDGSIDSTVEINYLTENGPVLADDDRYGRSIANIGDLNGDGIQDLAVGALGDDSSSLNNGAVYIHFMNTDGSIYSTTKIDGFTTNGADLFDEDHYGISITNMGDLDGDGTQDLVVGANLDNDGGTDRGAIYIHYLSEPNIIYPNFQGRLLTGPTTPAANYTFHARFSFWDDEDYVAATDKDGSGDLVGAAWQEVQTLTTDSQGFFMAKVGFHAPLPEFDPLVHRYIQTDVKATASPNTSYFILDNIMANDAIDRKSILDSVYAQNALRLNGRDVGTDAGDIPFLNANGQLDRALLDAGTWFDPVADIAARDAITGMVDGSVVYIESENSLYVYKDTAWEKTGYNLTYNEAEDKYEFGGSRISGLGGPTEASDVATKEYVDVLVAEVEESGGTYVGITTIDNFTGAIMDGYVGGDTACRVDYPGSHVCRTDEILAAISTKDIGTLFSYSDLAGAWILEGAPGYTAPANDCNGLTDGTANYLGAFWQFDNITGGTGQLSICSQEKPLACCL